MTREASSGLVRPFYSSLAITRRINVVLFRILLVHGYGVASENEITGYIASDFDGETSGEGSCCFYNFKRGYCLLCFTLFMLQFGMAVFN